MDVYEIEQPDFDIVENIATFIKENSVKEKTDSIIALGKIMYGKQDFGKTFYYHTRTERENK